MIVVAACIASRLVLVAPGGIFLFPNIQADNMPASIAGVASICDTTFCGHPTLSRHLALSVFPDAHKDIAG